MGKNSPLVAKLKIFDVKYRQNVKFDHANFVKFEGRKSKFGIKVEI